MFFDSVSVSANSWHYRWLASWRVSYWRPPVDFCTYFWLLVLQVTILVGLSAGSGFLFAALVAWILVVPWEALLVIGVVVGIIAAAIGGGFFAAYMSEGGNQKVANSLVGRFVKAKKNKYCPMVNYIK